MVEIVKSLDVYKKMSFGEQLDFLLKRMVEVQKEITALARQVARWNQNINEDGERLKSVVKSLKGVAVRKGVLKDILKGNVGFASELFKKESDGIRKYTKNLRYVI